MSTNQSEREADTVEGVLVAAALDREIARTGSVYPAMANVCRALGDYLGRWVGRDGWQALLQRALDGSGVNGGPSGLGFDLGSEVHGRVASGTVAARETCIRVLVSVVRMLARFVGRDMAMQLVKLGLAESEDRGSGGTGHD